MWKVYNEFGEFYSESYSEHEAEKTASQVNGYIRWEDTGYNPSYEDDWMY